MLYCLAFNTFVIPYMDFGHVICDTSSTPKPPCPCVVPCSGEDPLQLYHKKGTSQMAVSLATRGKAVQLCQKVVHIM